MVNRSYSPEELLSFDRLRRAVMHRVVEKAEQALAEGAPLDQNTLSELTAEEWKKAKDAVRSSPAAREAAKEHMQRLIGEMVDDLMRSDKAELDALGVQEKTI